MGEEAIIKRFADLRARKSAREQKAMEKLLRQNEPLLTHLVPNLYQHQPLPMEQLCDRLSECTKEREWSRECIKECVSTLESIAYIQESEDGYIVTDDFQSWLRGEGVLADLRKGKGVLHF